MRVAERGPESTHRPVDESNTSRPVEVAQTATQDVWQETGQIDRPAVGTEVPRQVAERQTTARVASAYPQAGNGEGL